MKKQYKERVKMVHNNWSGMLKTKNKPKLIQGYFLGAWTAFDDKQATSFIKMCTKKELEVIMRYPIWQ